MTQSDTHDVPPELKTVRDFLRYAVSGFRAAGLAFGHGSSSVIDDAAFLILETLHLPIDRLEPFLDARLTAAERQLLKEAIELRISTRKPSAYLTRRAYIQGIDFYVDERVIVPRSFIGELLFSDLFGDGEASLVGDRGAVGHVLDLCTGSGCLAILAAMVFPVAEVDAVDLSSQALEVAKINIDRHAMAERVHLLQGDLYAPLVDRRYDLILTNPPYVDQRAMAALPAEYRHEPALALAGGEDGLDTVRRIIAEAPMHLSDEGGLLCEIGSGRELLEAEFPQLDFLWLETAESEGEVFWLPASAFS